MPTPINPGPLDQQQYVAYLDLSGGRNTKKDPHALDRNQLAVSDNTWMAQGNTIAKRPGTAGLAISAGQYGGGISEGAISTGSVGSAVGAKAMVEGRFFNQTALVVQGTNNQLYAAPMALPGISSGSNVWISIGRISGGTLNAAQLFDPDPTNANGPDGTLFLVDGIDTPKKWLGPGNVIAPIPTAQLPTKKGSALPITPAYVAALFGSIFYAGDPSDPNAVYVSDPFRPESFTVNMLIPTGSVTTSTYIPAWIGRGDGYQGGPITGFAVMGSAMIVYKQSSIYAMTQVGVLGDMIWGSACVSSSVGSVSPRSIVPFDTYHCFLGIDGVYMFDGQQSTKISKNNPDLFDGPTAQILDRNTAIGVRYGNKYLIFFDNGNGTGTALGYPCAGAWFDFDKPDVDGLPAVGTISGMFVGGAAPLRGPNDLGNFAWADAARDRVGTFNAVQNGQPVYSDFGVSINSTVLGKADFFSDVWGDEAPVDEKQVDSVNLLMSFPIVINGQTYTFNGTMYFDQLGVATSVGNSAALNVPGAAVVGSAVVGTAVLGVVQGTPAYQAITMFQGAPSTGRIIQFGFSEASTLPWTCLGYTEVVNRQRGVLGSSG